MSDSHPHHPPRFGDPTTIYLLYLYVTKDGSYFLPSFIFTRALKTRTTENIKIYNKKAFLIVYNQTLESQNKKLNGEKEEDVFFSTFSFSSCEFTFFCSFFFGRKGLFSTRVSIHEQYKLVVSLNDWTNLKVRATCHTTVYKRQKICSPQSTCSFFHN